MTVAEALASTAVVGQDSIAVPETEVVVTKRLLLGSDISATVVSRLEWEFRVLRAA
jgi:hypothetical protein